MRVVVGVILLLLIAAHARAQSFTGRVFDKSDSLTVSGAQIQVDGSRGLRSDGFGRFTISKIAPGRHEIRVRMLGYAAWTDSVDFAEQETVTRDIHLTRLPRLLSTMVVKGRSVRVPFGFEDVYRRATTGAGSFITRERIDSINPRDIAGLLHEVPFVRISGYATNADRVTTSRCRPIVSGARISGQMVSIWFNGVPLTDTASINEVLDHTPPSMIQAVEVYNGSTSVPPIFQPTCGAIAIWTRKQ